MGVAAHITAASQGGPRYDPLLAPHQRRHFKNAIWLCQTCGKLADNDESRFTVEELYQWKCSAEARAFAKIGRAATSFDPTQTNWSPEKLELLREAANDGELDLLSSAQLGSWVRVGPREFIDQGDPAVGASYREALELLVKRGLVKHEGGVSYKLTGSDFKIARALRDLN